MTFGQKTAIAILLLVARMICDEKWADEIKGVATHISVNEGRK